MRGYILRRLLFTIPILVGVCTIVFLLMRVTGDPIELMYAGDNRPERIAEMNARRRELGLDRPLIVQYASYLWDSSHGDLGVSFVTRRPVTAMLLERLPVTIELSVAALVLSYLIAVPVGILSATRRNTLVDDVSMVGALLGVSMPNFWLGLMLVLLFSLQLGLLPPSGIGSPGHLVMPAITLGTAQAAISTRLIRASLLEVLGQDYLRTAAGKGLAQRTILVRHALRNALIPVVTVLGLQVGHLVGGAVIVETVFGRAGIGTLMLNSIFNRDFAVVQGGVLLIAATVVLSNLVVDVLYFWLDPRIVSQG